jgi:dolichol-phosphate mannosyltransferase
MRISLVIPVCNEEGNLGPLAAVLEDTLAPWPDHELLFVDDGSDDGSLEIIKSLAFRNSTVRWLSFSRNFGHQAALRAGLEASCGDCVITMDSDFQHPPSLIPDMIAAWEKGFEVVTTRRLDSRPGRQGKPDGSEGFLKRTGSRLFYALINSIGDVRIEPGAADFRLLSSRAKDALLSMREQSLFLRGAVPWMGFPSQELSYEPAARKKGETKYTMGRMLALALDGITSFSIKPLRLTSVAGLLISGLGFAYALYALAIRLFTDRTVEGWTSILISILIIGGIQLISLGIMGEYLGKLFMEVKGRPHYIIKDSSPLPCPGSETTARKGQAGKRAVEETR